MKKAFSLSPEEADELVKKQDQVAQEAQNQKPDGKQPEDIALAAVGKAYGKGAAPDIEAQLEQIAGLQPSAVHEGNMESAATGNVAQQMQHVAQAHEALAGPMPQDQPQDAPQGAPQGVESAPSPAPVG
jgi:hypothetical protein